MAETVTNRVWLATGNAAALWRSSEYVREYVAGAHARLAFVSGRGGDHVVAQPFFLPMYLPTVPMYSRLGQHGDTQPWEEQGNNLAMGYITLIEWLRSRLPGYPFAGTPLLTAASPWTDFTVSMRVPWLLETRGWQLQDRAQPPTMPFLKADAAAQGEAGTELGIAIVSSPAVTELGQDWSALTAGDRQALEKACAGLADARYTEPDDVRGDEDFRKLAWSEFILHEALNTLPAKTRKFTDSLTRTDQLIQQVAALFCQQVMYAKTRKLGHITHVDQLDGADGWYTIQSDCHITEPIRQFEILGFDYPHPRGVMFVQGINEHLSTGAFQQVSITVHGPILPESEALASSAEPIQPLFVAPQDPHS